MKKYAVALTFLLVVSGCGGSSDTGTPATTVAPSATQASTTTAVPTTTAAPTTTTGPATTTTEVTASIVASTISPAATTTASPPNTTTTAPQATAPPTTTGGTGGQASVEGAGKGRPTDRYACNIDSLGYCIFTGVPHQTGLDPGTEDVVDRDGNFLFAVNEAVAVNAQGEALQARGTPAFDGDDLQRSSQDGLSEDEKAFQRVMAIMFPIRNALMYDIAAVTQIEWDFLVGELGRREIKETTFTSGLTPKDNYYGRQGIFDLAKDPGRKDIHHDVMKFLEEAGLYLLCHVTTDDFGDMLKETHPEGHDPCGDAGISTKIPFSYLAPTTVAPTTTAPTEALEIWEEVYVEIRRIAAERPRRGQTINLRAAPGFSDEHLEVVTAAYAEAADFWSGGFDFAETILLVIVDETDRTWWETEMSLLEGERFNPGWFSEVHESAAHGMVEVDTNGVPHIVSATGSQTDFGQNAVAALAQLVAHHETTHWFQYLATGSKTDRCLLMGDPSCPWTYLPCWLTEGHAELYMKAFADGLEDNPVPSSVWREVRLAGIGKSIPDAASVTAQGWLDYLWLPRTSTEPRCIGSGGPLGYSLGLPVNEILFYDFGDAKINEWLLTTGTYPSTPSCPSWFNAFEDVFGVSVENWYRTSGAPYLLDTFSSDRSAKDVLTFDPDGFSPYCQPGQVGATETGSVAGETGSDTVDPLE